MRRLGYVLLLAVAVLIGGIGATLAYSSLNGTEPAFAPLGRYSTQYATPAIRDGEPLQVTGKKCNKTSHPVEVRGSFVYVSVIPEGYRIPGFSGAGVRKPGCEAFHFTNDTTALSAVNNLLFAQGLTQVAWKIVGGEVPIDSSGRDGRPKVYESTVFTVSP